MTIVDWQPEIIISVALCLIGIGLALVAATL